MAKIRIRNEHQTGAEAGTVIEVSDDRAARWIRRGWAEDAAGATPHEPAELAALPTKKADLVALFEEEIGKAPADVLEKVTVKTLTEALEERRAEGAQE